MSCRTTPWLSVLLAAIAALHGFAEQGEIDWTRARELRQRALRGDPLNAEDQAYLQRAIEARKTQSPKPPVPTTPVKPPMGLKPLTDLSGGERYRGEDGGLYGGGSNQPPQQHLAAALSAAAKIQPLDGDGNPSADGTIGFISVGMSNTTQEFSTFVRLANADPAKSAKVVLVDGAQGGMDARAWAVPNEMERKGRPNPWSVLDERLQRAGIGDKQVQVAWLKQARIAPGTIGDFPKHGQEMQTHLAVILNRLKEKFPNLQLCYLSSRTYGGYAKTPLNPEPYAYESAFVVRWLIQDQAKGQASLNYDPQRGSVRAPLLLWGPYLWTDGEQGRKVDSFVWKPEDAAPDGTHPSDSGRQKVAELLLRFLKTDPTAKVWFVAPK